MGASGSEQHELVGAAVHHVEEGFHTDSCVTLQRIRVRLLIISLKFWKRCTKGYHGRLVSRDFQIQTGILTCKLQGGPLTLQRCGLAKPPLSSRFHLTTLKAPHHRIIPPHVQPIILQDDRMLINVIQSQLHTRHDPATLKSHTKSPPLSPNPFLYLFRNFQRPCHRGRIPRCKHHASCCCPCSVSVGSSAPSRTTRRGGTQASALLLLVVFS